MQSGPLLDVRNSNGTHEDAPAHFVANGRTVEQMDLQDCIGDAYVIPGGEDWDKRIPGRLASVFPIRGPEAVTLEQAKVLTDRGIRLVATETQKMGDADVHRELLGHGVVTPEGVDLDVRSGMERRFLCAQPLKLGGSEGAPCEARIVVCRLSQPQSWYHEDSHLRTSSRQSSGVFSGIRRVCGCAGSDRLFPGRRQDSPAHLGQIGGIDVARCTGKTWRGLP